MYIKVIDHRLSADWQEVTHHEGHLNRKLFWSLFTVFASLLIGSWWHNFNTLLLSVSESSCLPGQVWIKVINEQHIRSNQGRLWPRLDHMVISGQADSHWSVEGRIWWVMISWSQQTMLTHGGRIGPTYNVLTPHGSRRGMNTSEGIWRNLTSQFHPEAVDWIRTSL